MQYCKNRATYIGSHQPIQDYIHLPFMTCRWISYLSLHVGKCRENTDMSVLMRTYMGAGKFPLIGPKDFENGSGRKLFRIRFAPAV
mgnify:CR=1 FL=1